MKMSDYIPKVNDYVVWDQGDYGYNEGWVYFAGEEYVPGTRNNPGYVKSYKDKVEVPCHRESRPRPEFMPSETSSNVDDNSCVEGSIIGGITGGALGGVLSTKDNWIWSIPAGVIGGSMVGCQVDGG